VCFGLHSFVRFWRCKASVAYTSVARLDCRLPCFVLAGFISDGISWWRTEAAGWWKPVCFGQISAMHIAAACARPVASVNYCSQPHLFAASYIISLAGIKWPLVCCWCTVKKLLAGCHLISSDVPIWFIMPLERSSDAQDIRYYACGAGTAGGSWALSFTRSLPD